MIETSIFLAKVIGLASVISAGAVLLRYKDAMVFEKEAVKNTSLTYASGFVFLVVGILLIVSHSFWTADWRVVITLLSWAILIKGLGRILFPKAVAVLIERKQNNRWFMAGEIFLFVVGFYLLYYGFVVY